jgi:hypothetical protein
MRHVFCVFSAFALSLVGVSGARGDIVVGSPNLPPPEGQYITPALAHQLYQIGALTIQAVRIRHSGFLASFPPPLTVGASTSHTFGSTLQGQIIVNNGPPAPFTDPATVSVTVTKASGPAGSSPLGTFNTQMTQLDVDLGGGMKIRIDPTTPSVGQTTISDAGGGQFRINSFFDIFTDLSLDNGATWTPSSVSGHVDLTANPEPSSLVLGSIGAVVCLGAVRARRRRSRSAA